MLAFEGIEISTPSLVFTGMYYPQIFRELLRYHGINASELTSRDPSDPAIQILTSFAAGMHYISCLADHIAMESLPGTARMIESVRQHLYAIGYKMALTIPSEVDVLAKLESPLTISASVVSSGSLFETSPDGDDDPVSFEYVYSTPITIGPTNVFSAVYSLLSIDEPLNNGSVDSDYPTYFTKTGGVDFTDDYIDAALYLESEELNNHGLYFIKSVIDVDTVELYDADFVSEINIRWTLKVWSEDSKSLINNDVSTWDPWGDTGITPQPGDVIYFASEYVMFTSILFRLTQSSYGLSFLFEYYDGSSASEHPDSVTVDESIIVFDITTLLGDAELKFSEITITYLPNSSSEICYSYYEDGINKVKSKSIFGQSDTVSVNIEDYVVSCYWRIPDNIVDRSQNISLSGKVTFDIPQSLVRNWTKCTINDHEAYWIRCRIVDLTTLHGSTDTDNDVDIDDATNLAEAIILANSIKSKYNLHIVVEGLVHKIEDTTNLVGESDATDEDSLVLLINDIKEQFNSHIDDITYHYTSDDANIVVLDDADAESDDSWLELVNTLKFSYNAHILSISPSAPIMRRVRLDDGDQYALVQAVQGETVFDYPLGSSNGLAGQRFKVYRKSIIDGTVNVDIDETGEGNWIRWVQVEHFLSSYSSDRHFVVDVNGDEDAYIVFGGELREDGINRFGKIPPLGLSNVRCSYRMLNSELNGNVGSSTIDTMRTGTRYIQSVTNPRSAIGWIAREGSTNESLEIAKVNAANNVRSNERAVTVDDICSKAVAWVDTVTNSKLVARAFAIEEAYGSKTVGLWVVGQGGLYLTTEQLERLETYFNGDYTTVPNVMGVCLANIRVYALNYVKRKIGINVITRGGNRLTILRELASLIHPLKTLSDGVTYLWIEGDEVPPSKVIDVVHGISESIRRVELVEFDEPIILAEDQLPFFDPSTTEVTVVDE